MRTEHHTPYCLGALPEVRCRSQCEDAHSEDDEKQIKSSPKNPGQEHCWEQKTWLQRWLSEKAWKVMSSHDDQYSWGSRIYVYNSILWTELVVIEFISFSYLWNFSQLGPICFSWGKCEFFSWDSLSPLCLFSTEVFLVEEQRPFWFWSSLMSEGSRLESAESEGRSNNDNNYNNNG